MPIPDYEEKINAD
jgi:dynein heavy chain